MIVCDKCMTNPADLGTIYVEVAGNRQGIDICRECFRKMFSDIEVARKAFCAQVNFDKDEPKAKMPAKPEPEFTALERQRGISDFHPREVTVGRMTWMAENLVLSDGGEGIYHDDGNQEVYYTYDAAVRIAGKIPGWHLPDREEWYNLTLSADARNDPGNLLASSTNTSGMSIKLSGSISRKFLATAATRGYPSLSLYEYGFAARFWSSDENLDSSDEAWYRYFDKSGYFNTFTGDKSEGMFSVRLVKDS